MTQSSRLLLTWFSFNEESNPERNPSFWTQESGLLEMNKKSKVKLNIINIFNQRIKKIKFKYFSVVESQGKDLMILMINIITRWCQSLFCF